MEDAHFTETEKRKTSEVKCENEAHCFFSMFEESYTGNSFLLDRLLIRNLLGGFEAIERECAKKTPRIVEIG